MANEKNKIQLTEDQKDKILHAHWKEGLFEALSLFQAYVGDQEVDKALHSAEKGMTWQKMNKMFEECDESADEILLEVIQKLEDKYDVDKLVVYNSVFGHMVKPNDEEWEEAKQYDQYDSDKDHAYIDDTYITTLNKVEAVERSVNYMKDLGEGCFNAISEFKFDDIDYETKMMIKDEIKEEGFLEMGWFLDRFGSMFDKKNVISSALKLDDKGAMSIGFIDNGSDKDRLVINLKGRKDEGR